VALSLETRDAFEEHRRGGDVFDSYDRADGSSTIFLGDVVLLIASDGFTECRSDDDRRRQFGTTGIVRALAATASHSHGSASRAVAARADSFTSRRYDDDATLAAVARSGVARPGRLAP